MNNRLVFFFEEKGLFEETVVECGEKRETRESLVAQRNPDTGNVSGS